MTKIKLCGLRRPQDIEVANALLPDYVGFVFAESSRRYVRDEDVLDLKKYLDPTISTVGVFVDETPERVAWLLNSGLIDIAQLHGSESMAYLHKLREMTDKPIWKAFTMEDLESTFLAKQSIADMVVLDSGGGGTGTIFNWQLLEHVDRPYFLAGGLTPENIRDTVKMLEPYGVDVSSGIETGGKKDPKKMEAFVREVRRASGAGV